MFNNEKLNGLYDSSLDFPFPRLSIIFFGTLNDNIAIYNKSMHKKIPTKEDIEEKEKKNMKRE